MTSGLRKFDLAESTFWLLDRASSMNFAVMARLSGSLDTEQIRSGLAFLQKKHPLLQCSVQHDAEKGELAFLHRGLEQSIPLAIKQVGPESSFNGDSGTLAESEREDAAASNSGSKINGHGELSGMRNKSLEFVAQSMMEAFAPETWPLMRAFLLRGPQDLRLVLIFHHSIADGRSGIRLLQELIAFLADPESAGLLAKPSPEDAGTGNESTSEGPAAEGSKLPGGLHSLLPGSSRPPALEENPALPVSFYRKKSSDASPWLVELCLNSDETEALRRRSKQWGCTLHGMLGGILLSALARCDAAPGENQINDAGEGISLHRLALASPADMRGKLASGADDLALYISLITTTANVDASLQGLPELSRSISADVRRQIEDRPLEFYHLLPDPKRYLSKADPGKAYGALISRLPPAAALSNAGVVSDFSSAKDGSWMVENVSFSVHPSLSQMVFVAATTYGGSLTLTVNLDSSRWSEGLPLRYVQKVEGMCKAVAETKY
ncbi:MAG: hypothetical protein KDK25_10360 [Leptospiraceae bacterium]|nr:hypothetical protein [Leptospiraceae bacterium]